MKSTWFEGARDGEAKQNRKAEIVAAQAAFEVLTGILEGRVKSKESERNQPEKLELPDYPTYQAYVSGYLKGIQEVLSLLDHKE